MMAGTQQRGPTVMQTFAIAHQKGGVGKTTTTAHLGRALTDRGHRVLLVDLDPQGSLTALLGIGDKDSSEGCATWDTNPDMPLAQLAVSTPWGLDAVPAVQRLGRLERSGEPGVEQLLRIAIQNAPVDRWDVVLIDAPGTMGILTTMALVAAADGIIVPTTADYLAVEPLNGLVRLAQAVQQRYQPGAVVRGVIINAVAPTREHNDGQSEIRQAFGDRVLGVVPRRTVIQDAAAAAQPLSALHTGPSAELRAIYEAIATKLEDEK